MTQMLQHYLIVQKKSTGQSATYFVERHKTLGIFNQYDFGVCSRNLRLKTPNNSSYWTVAKQFDIEKVLIELFENPRDPEDIIKEKGWIQISNEGAIKEVVLKIIEANPQSVADFKAGKDRALGFLVGQAMKETKGKANPQMLNKMFAEELKK
mgnify:CR=1 FL=1